MGYFCVQNPGQLPTHTLNLVVVIVVAVIVNGIVVALIVDIDIDHIFTSCSRLMLI